MHSIWTLPLEENLLLTQQSSTFMCRLKREELFSNARWLPGERLLSIACLFGFFGEQVVSPDKKIIRAKMTASCIKRGDIQL